MSRPHRLLQDTDRSQVESLGFNIMALGLQYVGDVVDAHRKYRLTLRAPFLVDCKSSPVEVFGIRIATLVLIDPAQIAEACSLRGAVRNGPVKRPPQACFRLAVGSLLSVHVRKVVESEDEVIVVR